MYKKNAVALLSATLMVGFAQRTFADAKALYEKHCKKCHAEDGSGKKDGEWLPVVKTLKIEAHPEGLNILSADAKKLTSDEMIKLITEGKEKGKMKGFKEKLTADEIKELAEYTKQLQAKAK